MKFWQFFKRNLKETYRDPLALGFLLAFPLLFMIVFMTALGGDNTPTYTISVIDDDNSQVSNIFIEDILAQIPVFQINRDNSISDALSKLEMGNLNAYIVIPDGFGDAVDSNWQGIITDIKLDIVYDESDMDISGQIVSTVNLALRNFAKIEIPISISANPINIENKPGQIDFLAPGIIVFGILIMIPTSARIMVRDREKGYLARLLTTPTRPWEFIMGYTLCLLLIAVLQIIFFIICGILLGMHVAGNIWLAFLIFTLTAISSISIGMIAAAFSKSESQAEPLCWLFSMPLAMLSGVWFSMSYMPEYIQVIANLFPYSHAVEASRSVLVRGAELAAVQSDVIFLTVWAIAITILGILLFGRTMRS
jgi:ABC-2 type transport system permease protein